MSSAVRDRRTVDAVTLADGSRLVVQVLVFRTGDRIVALKLAPKDRPSSTARMGPRSLARILEALEAARSEAFGVEVSEVRATRPVVVDVSPGVVRRRRGS